MKGNFAHMIEVASRASSLGVIGILFGILSASWHANEWMKFAIVGEPPYTMATMPEPECDEDELVEEGVSLMECHQLAFAVHDISISSPHWYKSFHIAVSAVGSILAILSIIVSLALVDDRSWASMIAAPVFGTLAILDVVSFIALVNTGPLIRQMYLWSSLLWFFIHLAMTLGAIVLRQMAAKPLTDARLGSTGTVRGYSRTAAILHMVLAVSIFFLFASSWWMLGLPLASAEYRFREFPFQLHKNLGITLVAIVLAMLYVRFRYRPQPALKELLPSGMSRLATIDHVILYAIMLACCVTGYLSSSYSGWSTRLWWLVDLPEWGYEHEELNVLYSDLHLWTCWLLLAVLAVHISGALYHAFRSDGVMRRMLHL